MELDNNEYNPVKPNFYNYRGKVEVRIVIGLAKKKQLENGTTTKTQ